jgi:alpha-glucosidase
MSDFAEYLPFDAMLYGGHIASRDHNLFPVSWAALNRDAVQVKSIIIIIIIIIHLFLQGTDAIFFSRSGFTQSAGQSTLFWLGDQLVTWDAYDGLATVETDRIYLIIILANLI